MKELLLILASYVLIALGLVEIAINVAEWLERPIAKPQILITNADYPLCVHVKPGPIVKPRGPVLYPNRSDLS